MANNEGFISRELAKKFFGRNDQAYQKKDFETKVVDNKTKQVSRKQNEDKAAPFNAPVEEKKATPTKVGKENSSDLHPVKLDKIMNATEDDEEGRECVKEDEKPVKAKKKSRTGDREFTKASNKDENNDGFTSSDEDYGDYEDYEDYETPELYMGDPRDREIAGILYGPGAEFDPQNYTDLS